MIKADKVCDKCNSLSICSLLKNLTFPKLDFFQLFLEVWKNSIKSPNFSKQKRAKNLWNSKPMKPLTICRGLVSTTNNECHLYNFFSKANTVLVPTNSCLISIRTLQTIGTRLFSFPRKLAKKVEILSTKVSFFLRSAGGNLIKEI